MSHLTIECLLLFTNTLFALANYKNKRYETAMISSCAAGMCLSSIINIIL